MEWVCKLIQMVHHFRLFLCKIIPEISWTSIFSFLEWSWFFLVYNHLFMILRTSLLCVLLTKASWSSFGHSSYGNGWWVRDRHSIWQHYCLVSSLQLQSLLFDSDKQILPEFSDIYPHPVFKIRLSDYLPEFEQMSCLSQLID